MYGEDCSFDELVFEGGVGLGQAVAQPGERLVAAVQESGLVRGRQRLRAGTPDRREGGARLQRRGADQLVVLPRGGLARVSSCGTTLPSPCVTAITERGQLRLLVTTVVSSFVERTGMRASYEPTCERIL